MKKKFIFLAMMILSACSNQPKPLSNADKEKIKEEVKGVVSAIFQACETCNPGKLTSLYMDSPEFIAFINGEFSDFETTVRKYPVLMSDFRVQKPTIISEKYSIFDASTVLYSSKSNWDCTFKNDSIGTYNNCSLQILLKKVDNNWKVLSWSESY